MINRQELTDILMIIRDGGMGVYEALDLIEERAPTKDSAVEQIGATLIMIERRLQVLEERIKPAPPKPKPFISEQRIVDRMELTGQDWEKCLADIEREGELDARKQ